MAKTTLSEGDMISVKIRTFDSATDSEPHYTTYSVPYIKQMRVLEVLTYLTNSSESVAYRYSCSNRKCGTCGVVVNGVPKLACWEPVEKEMVIEPLANFPVIKDLVIDRSGYDEKIKNLMPFMVRAASPTKFPEDIQPGDMIERNRFDQCIGCFLCVSACPIMASNPSFVGPAAAVKVAALAEDFRDSATDKRLALEAVTGESGLWRCHMIGECSEVCPVHAEPSLAIQRLRRKAVAGAARGLFKKLRRAGP